MTARGDPLLLIPLLIVIVVVANAIVIITTITITTIIISRVATQSAGLAWWRDLPQAAGYKHEVGRRFKVDWGSARRLGLASKTYSSILGVGKRRRLIST